MVLAIFLCFKVEKQKNIAQKMVIRGMRNTRKRVNILQKSTVSDRKKDFE